jgi:hypothetical protein
MRAWLAVLLALVVSVEVDIAELVALQHLRRGELQRRFNLPLWCDPVVSAMRRRHGKITVQITCRDDARPPRVDAPAAAR